MWLHICMAGPMMAYRCDVTSVLAAQMPCWPTNFCLLLLSAVPYFTYLLWFTPGLGSCLSMSPQGDEVYGECQIEKEYHPCVVQKYAYFYIKECQCNTNLRSLLW